VFVLGRGVHVENSLKIISLSLQFLEVMSELSSLLARPKFSHIKLEKILGQFVTSYDKLLSVVISGKEPRFPDHKGMSAQDVKDADTGLVNHGLKIDVTTSSPFHRRFGARRAMRTHSCRESRSGTKG
jgi:hypothetical protein